MKSLETQVNGDHYQKKSIQPIEYIIANDLSFIEGNIVKYITRHSEKNGEADAQKVLHYVFMLLENEYGVEPKKAFDSLFTESVGNHEHVLGSTENTSEAGKKHYIVKKGGVVDASPLSIDRLNLKEKLITAVSIKKGYYLKLEANWKEVLEVKKLPSGKVLVAVASIDVYKKQEEILEYEFKNIVRASLDV